jgi:tetratricopeptide (TPR) repeat protein
MTAVAPTASPESPRRSAGIALLFLATFVAYAGAWDAGFIWDDEDYVLQNPLLRAPDGLWRIWFSPSELPQYYPLVHTTFWIEHQLWGVQPLGYHLVNVALHALNAVLFVGILRKLEVPGALLAGLLFALHPVHVESVAWITERKNVLSGALYLLSLGAWLRYTDGGPRRSMWWSSFALFILALLSKTVTCSLPAVFLLLAWWRAPAEVSGLRAAMARFSATIPFFVVGFAAAMVTAALERGHVRADGPEFAFSIADRVLIAGRALWFYAGSLLWPFGTCFNYPRWVLDASDPVQWAYPIGAAVLLVALVRAIPRLGRTPVFVALCFGGSLVPALGFFNIYPMRYSFVADHFQYLANLAPLALVAALGARVALSRTPTVQTAMKVSAALLAALLGGLTYRSLDAYRDVESLWTVTVAANPDSWLARTNLAGYQIQRGELDRAIESLEHSLAVQRRSGHEATETWMALGLAHWRGGQLEDARAAFEAGRRADPDNNQNLAWLGGLLLELGENEAAGEALDRSIEIREDNWTAQAFLAELRWSEGNLAAAVRHADVALALNSLAFPALRARARALRALGRIDEAIQTAGKALLRDSASDATRQMFVDVLVDSLRSFEPDRAGSISAQVFAQIPADLANGLREAVLARLTDPDRRTAVANAIRDR